MDNLKAFTSMSVMLACACWAFFTLEPKQMMVAIVLFSLCGFAGYYMGVADANYERDDK